MMKVKMCVDWDCVVGLEGVFHLDKDCFTQYCDEVCNTIINDTPSIRFEVDWEIENNDD